MRGGPQRLGVRFQQHGADAVIGDHAQVGDGHVGLEPGQQAGRIGADSLRGGLGHGRETLVALCGFGVLKHIRPRHPVVPVQSLGAAGSDADQDGCPGQPLGEQRGAGQGMGTAAGTADHGEFAQAVGVRDGQHVGGRVGDPAALEAIGLPVSRPVEGDELDTHPVQDSRSRPRAEAASRGPVQQENRSSFRVTVHLGGKPPAVRRFHRVLQDRSLPFWTVCRRWAK